MGRGVQPDAVSGSVKDRGERCGGRALSVRPGHDDGRAGALRAAERAEEGADATQAGADAAALEGVEPVDRVHDGRFTPSSGAPRHLLPEREGVTPTGPLP